MTPINDINETSACYVECHCELERLTKDNSKLRQEPQDLLYSPAST